MSITRAMTARRVLYLDLVGGAAGDMLLAALLDAGASLDAVREAITAFGLPCVELEIREASPAGLRARRVDVRIRGRLEAPAAEHEREHEHEHEHEHAHDHDNGHDHDHVHDHDHDHGHGHGHEHEHEHDQAHAHEDASHENASHENGTHENASHENARHENASYESATHENATHENATRENASHEIASHENASNASHENASHGNASHENASHAHSHRPYRVIRDRLEGAPLAPRVRSLALETFRLLAHAEGEAHGIDPESIHFHEVGSDDAIADILGVSAALTSLDPSEVIVSPVPLGRGLTRGAHGPIPLPGPATLALLRGVPVEGTPLRGETITPTGAALLRAIATRFGPAPAMILESIGIGAGHKSWPDRPNIIRALVGRTALQGAHETRDELIVEANIDDMTPEHLAALKRELFTAGAIDVWSSPIAMKKDRSGFQISCLARATLLDVIATTFFTHATTLGIRYLPITRLRAERRIETVDTPYGPIRVKIADRPQGPPLISPEHDDCQRQAEAHHTSLRAVSEAALRSAWTLTQRDS